MPGRMGGDRKTEEGLKILRIDPQRDLIYVKGHVPGNRGSFVEIRDCLKRPQYPSPPPFPSYAAAQDGDEEPTGALLAPVSSIDPMLVDITKD